MESGSMTDTTPVETPIARYIRTHRETTQPTDAELAAQTRRRRTPGISQDELAARIGCSQPAVSGWESGIRVPDMLYVQGPRPSVGRRRVHGDGRPLAWPTSDTNEVAS